MGAVADHRMADVKSCAVVAQPACVVCGTPGKMLYEGLSDWLFGFPGSWSVKTCSDCEVLWLDPRPAEEEFPRLYARYYTHSESGETDLRGLRQATVQHVLAGMGYEVAVGDTILPRLLSYVPSIARTCSLDVLGLPRKRIGRLLDVGCGSGEFVRRMRSLGWDAVGIDPDHEAVQRGREGGLEVREGTIAHLSEKENYDVIALNHVIEHVADPVLLLKECRTRLRSQNGILVITTPNVKSLGHAWFKRYWRGLEIPRHLTVFSPAALSKCVADSGLHVCALRTETRLARMIFNSSTCAKHGEIDVGDRSEFPLGVKWKSYAFQLAEEALSYINGDVGEEIYCVCTLA
jgi:2-polyprenyl-3-methyl-5-hydroxy-6-metoxy-1,4-benzoquinol methylase